MKSQAVAGTPVPLVIDYPSGSFERLEEVRVEVMPPAGPPSGPRIVALVVVCMGVAVVGVVWMAWRWG